MQARADARPRAPADSDQLAAAQDAFARRRTADPDDADRASARRRGDRDDRVRVSSARRARRRAHAFFERARRWLLRLARLAPCTSAGRSGARSRVSSTAPVPTGRLRNMKVKITGMNSIIFACRGSPMTGVHLLLDEHRRAHQQRKDVRGIVRRQVADPQILPAEQRHPRRQSPEADERRVLHLHRDRERDVQRVEDRDLHDHRQAAAERVDLVASGTAPSSPAAAAAGRSCTSSAAR